MGFSERNKGPDWVEPNRKPARVSSGQNCVVIRKDRGSVQEDGSLRLEGLVHDRCSMALRAVLATAEPGASSWEIGDSAGDKWYYVLEGMLEVVVNDDSYLLAAGDSIYLHSTGSCIWRNPTNERTKALVFAAPA